MAEATYPRRLIESDLPIKRISAHARREKYIHHGHISTLHIWWARRPLAACRAVLCASLWPDPVDVSEDEVRQARARGVELRANTCPPSFSEEARRLMLRWATTYAHKAGPESLKRLLAVQKDERLLDNGLELRDALLDFIADFARWENAADPEYLSTAQELTAAAHEALGGAKGTRPLAVDPFAGGGSIPLEALRIGADAFASDLNPVAVLLNKVAQEYIPLYGEKLAEAVDTWGQWIAARFEKELAPFYHREPDGAVPLAYLWARTVKCEGPDCGADVPLMRGLWLGQKAGRPLALRLVPLPAEKRVRIEIVHGARAQDVQAGTVRRGSATCPSCGFTTPVASVRRQLKARRGGADDARLLCVVESRPGNGGRSYRPPTERDLAAIEKATHELDRRRRAHAEPLSLVPDEPTPKGGGSGAGRAFSQRNYGMDTFADLFTARQALGLVTLTRLVREAGERVAKEIEPGLGTAVQVCLALAIDKVANTSASLCRWNSNGESTVGVFSRQALPMVWDYAETNVLAGGTGDLRGAIEWIASVVRSGFKGITHPGQSQQSSATDHPLPDDVADAFVTDPPYYDAVPYSDLSDFFYVWLKRALPRSVADSFVNLLTPKDEECIVDEVKGKDRAFFERTMAQAMAEGRRILKPSGIGLVVFAHKSTAGWEAQLQAMVDAGWTITGSWPIDTEMGSRLRAMDSAALASSIHLICRPREDGAGQLADNTVGDWRDVLQELPRRIHDWMPRLAAEGVVGADAIFACLGPALEVFSRYPRVEKASGERVPLQEYLEHVWGAVAKEALSIVLKDADTLGLEEDARLTAMWLWTLSAGSANGSSEASAADDETATDVEDLPTGGKVVTSGYVLEFDAARKIAQGLGAHLESLGRVIEVQGEFARLLSVSERAPYLFGKGESQQALPKKRSQVVQMDLFADLQQVTEGAIATVAPPPKPGSTVLDRIHQAMILFGSGRAEALKRFLVEDGAGNDSAFWRLAQSLSALYPSGSDEKRWVDGVLVRKKNLGF